MTINVANPFNTGDTESISDDEIFLNLFEPTVLDSIPWQTTPLAKPLVFWLSAEGGGKTTILRTFTPSVLKGVARKDEEDPTYRALHAIGAVDRIGPRVLGVHCKGSLSYSYLNDIANDENSRKRLFFALLNARAVLRGLKALTEVADLRYPEDLPLLGYDFKEDAEGLPPNLSMRGTGESLRLWARSIEKNCLDAIDAGGLYQARDLPKHDFFAAQLILDPKYWRSESGALQLSKTLIMIDDGQELTREQREWLAKSVTREREGAHVWVASRHNALDPADQFLGAQAGRELARIRLEECWSSEGSSNARPRQQRDFLIRVGTRRVKNARATAFPRYADMLEERPDGPTNEGRRSRETFGKDLEKLKEVVAHRTRGIRKYDKWVQGSLDASATPYERLVQLRNALIIIERGLNSPQAQISDSPLPLNELENRSDSGTKHAAQAFLAREFGAPLYYGEETMAYLATNNVQQFIALSERLYEEALSRTVKQAKDAPVPCAVQDRIVRKFADDRWNDMRSRFKDGKDMQHLLEVMAARLTDDFIRETAPYAPAPVGLSISVEEYELLKEGEGLSPRVQRLREVLARCLAENFLWVEKRHDKSEPHRVFYLNGVVLAKHGLPVKSRQFQPTDLEELASWFHDGYRSEKKARASMAGKKRKPRPPSNKFRSTLKGFMEEDEEDDRET